MTQLLKPIDLSEVKHLETDVRYLETENILYGSSRPQLNRANPTNLAPGEKLSKGYRDAVKGVMSSNLADDPHYLKGWDIAYADLKDIDEQIKQAGLAICYGLNRLSDARADLSLHQKQVQADERIVIWFDSVRGQYLLCASPTFVDREMPF